MQGHNELFQGGWNFLGLPQEFSDPLRARAWVLPIPYESTTCYGAGTRDAPAAIIAASRAIERYDRELGCEPARELGVHTLDPLLLMRRTPEAMIAAIEAAVACILSGAPAPELLAVLGGEHTLSAGVVRGLARHLKEREEDKKQAGLVAVQIDAHADLWDEYEGSCYSHACAARRIVETCPIFAIGIRNVSGAEDRFIRNTKRVKIVYAEEAMAPDGAFLSGLARFVRGKNVFLTIDLDGLDPSIMPAVGTPEPGGLSWARTLEVARTVFRHAACVPVFDVVELAPIPGLRAPDFLAAKLVYEIISLLLKKQGKRRTLNDE
ncbi:MAG: arginase family protein [Planctomycetota bacterium]